MNRKNIIYADGEKISFLSAIQFDFGGVKIEAINVNFGFHYLPTNLCRFYIL